MRAVSLMQSAVVTALITLPLAAVAQTTTPLSGHYPPGQSGIRGAATPDPGFSYTNFSRFLTNLEIRDPSGQVTGEVGELRFANISMITWTSTFNVLGMRYGALVGIPFATKDVLATWKISTRDSVGLVRYSSLRLAL